MNERLGGIPFRVVDKFARVGETLTHGVITVTTLGLHKENIAHGADATVEKLARAGEVMTKSIIRIATLGKSKHK